MLIKSEVKYIQNLSHKKFRDETGHFVAEGPKLINELLASPKFELHRLYATSEWFGMFPQQAASLPSDRITQVSDSDLERISFLATPHLVTGVFHLPENKEISGRSTGLQLMLDTIQDPGNMGTIIRCADWFGISDILCSENCADAFSPKVVQASMGSIARVNVHYLSLEEYLHKNAGLPVFTAELTGKPVNAIGKINKGILIIGNESKGIQPSLLASVPHTSVTIPKKGEAESLNAAVATAVLLSHLT